MNSNSWQHPFVNIFKHFEINSSKKCVKQGDVSPIMDRDLKSTVYRIRGLIPANNYIQFPSQSSNQNLGLLGRLFYILFRPIYDKYFCIHIDILTHEQHLIHISLSNMYREFKVTQTSIQFPYMTTGTDIHWSVLCLDLHTILSTYMTNEHFHMIKLFQLSGNMLVKNCFSSQFLYEPGIDNDTAKRTGLTRAGICSLPRELSYPITKGESWHDRYDFIMFPNSSSLMGKNQNEPFDKVGNVRLPTPRKFETDNENYNQIEDDEISPLTVQTTLVNGQINRSVTDFAHITHRSASLGDNQLNWRTYDNPIENFPSLPILPHNNNNNDGIHLFINPQTIPSSSSIIDDSNYDLALTTEHSQQSHLKTLLPDPILRLRTVIGLDNEFSNLLWTQDGNYILYSSNALVVQMHVETQQQWFFIGHTDRISAMAYNHNSSLLATIQTGQNAIVRLWKFETRHCINASRVLNTCDLYALDFSTGNSSLSLLIVGHDEQSRTVICIYNISNVYKGSIELISRATTDASITHIRFVPNNLMNFISIGYDNIRFWHITNENDLKSINIFVNNHDHFEYTDLQFDNLCHNKINELIVYIATKTGHILELLYEEKRVITIHYLSDKLKTNKESLFSISKLVCTDNFCLTGSKDGYVRVWSRDFTQVYIEAKYDQTISGLILSSDQTRVLISTISGLLNILNLITKVHSNLMRTHTKFITDIDYDDTRKQMISVGQDGTIRIWNFRTGKQLSEFTSEKDIPLIVVYTPDRQMFACGFNNGTIKIFDLNTSIISNEIKHHNISITGLLYSHNGLYLISCDEEGDLCLSDVTDNYRLLKSIGKAVVISKQGPMPLSLSPDGKYIVYIGPTEFIVTIIETNTLNQILRIDVSSCTFMTKDHRTIISSESAIFARFTPNRHLLVATINMKLLKFDSYTGKLLNIIDTIHKRSFDSLALSSDSQYLITSGDNMLKFWNANMELDINFQSFVGHSNQVRKILFTDDNMNVISIGDSILVWDVLAWNTEQPTMPNNAQCIVPPQSVMTKILENITVETKSNRPGILRNSQQTTDNTVIITQGEKKMIKNKLPAQRSNNEDSLSSPPIQRHFIQRINHSHLAKKRYVAPTNQESLKLQSIIGYNGNGRENLVWYPDTSFFAYTVGCNIIVEDLNNNHQTILTGHTEEISTMTLSNNGMILASAQCSISKKKDELQSKIIIWDTKILRQKLYFNQSVQAIQSMAFSKDDRYLITIGNYIKPIVTLWSTKNYSHLLNWQDDFSSYYINCVAWNSTRSNEFCLGGSHSTIRICTINEQTTNDDNISLQVINGKIPLIVNENTQKTCDITACNYLTSSINLVLCATNTGFITCWNSRLCLCVLHWKADLNEITYIATIKNKLLTGSSTGCLKLWNIENLEMNLGQLNTIDSNYGLIIQDEFQLDDGIISGSFDHIFDMGIVGTSCGSLWYICWTTDRSKTRLVVSHTDKITGLIPIEDTHIVTCSHDGTIRIFQLDDRNEILRFNTNGLKVTCLTSWNDSIVPTLKLSYSTSLMKNIKSNIKSIIAGYDDGTVRIFNLLHEQMILKLQPHTCSVTAIHVPLHTTISLSGAEDGSVAISNLVQGQLLRVLNEHLGSASICSIDSKKYFENNSYLWLITSHDRRVSLWKSNQQFDQCLLIDWLTFSASDTTNNWQSLPPSLARFIDTNTILYTGYGINKSIQIYNIDTKQIIRTISLSQWCLCFDLSNHFIAIGTNERLVQLKDYTQETFQDFIGNNDIISNIKFNKSNDLLITTSSNEIFIWKIVLN
ncbi:unnamed protein product [Adineta steineri]|uniref:Uncharacterized protein n=1 Tax=Adineta steineri TaxID=433720 RepID=A0A818X8F9_9BILA|nr:unnamed protein product [Adineta steineri]CAF3735484.1 unnamed protein product [Adineta steineri]